MELHSKSRNQNGRTLAVLGAGLILLAGCEDGQNFSPFKAGSNASSSSTAGAASSSGARSSNTPQDVEAPEVFQKTDMGLWDGRPSLGGIWVAHPDVTTPQRVIIRNTANNKSVVGALFRRERANPGPLIQVSSEAAGPLGMLAGAPAKLSVIALKREEIVQAPPEPEALPEAAPVEEATPIEPVEAAEVAAVATPEPVKTPDPAPAKPATAGASGAIEQTELDPVANAAAALDEVEGADTPAETSVAAAPAAKSKIFALQKPFIQVGTFSVEENANNAASTLRGTGMQPIVKTQGTGDKALWRVLVGPAANRAERRKMLKNIKGIGFDDAYFVTQ
jgi:cell division septation protein DedD